MLRTYTTYSHGAWYHVISRDAPGTGTVVHPSAHILAEGGPIFIGDNNLIQEQVTIINR